MPPVVSALPVLRGGLSRWVWNHGKSLQYWCFLSLKKKVPLSPLTLTLHLVAFSPPPVVKVSVKPSVCTKEM